MGRPYRKTLHRECRDNRRYERATRHEAVQGIALPLVEALKRLLDLRIFCAHMENPPHSGSSLDFPKCPQGCQFNIGRIR